MAPIIVFGPPARMVERFSDVRFRPTKRDSGAQKRDPPRRTQKPRLFAIRNLYFVDFAMLRNNSNSRFAIRSSGGNASRRFRAAAGNPEEKTAILSRLEVRWSLCFVGVAGNSNRGVSIRNPWLAARDLLGVRGEPSRRSEGAGSVRATKKAEPCGGCFGGSEQAD